jgi:hypothetical protein
MRPIRKIFLKEKKGRANRPGEDASLVRHFVFHKEADRVLSMARSGLCDHFDVFSDPEGVSVLNLLFKTGSVQEALQGL